MEFINEQMELAKKITINKYIKQVIKKAIKDRSNIVIFGTACTGKSFLFDKLLQTKFKDRQDDLVIRRSTHLEEDLNKVKLQLKENIADYLLMDDCVPHYEQMYELLKKANKVGKPILVTATKPEFVEGIIEKDTLVLECVCKDGRFGVNVITV